ncbi:MAG TPA: ATP-binding cassette domain-containing protein [Solirubrobacteraceae bacterium]|nr:ATP-binding cassette domain-containing protein [Solirubrobacteraceae bacterium]
MTRTGGALACQEVSVAFGPTSVLHDVSLELQPGEVHVLIGPNGAGKTTLANVISGHVSAQAGTVTLDNHALTGPPHVRARRGLGRKFQIPRVFPRLTAREQLELAAPEAELSHLHDELGELGDTPGAELSHGWRQWLELQMVLLQEPSVIVLDEPTSGLPRSERARLADAIDAVAKGTFLLVEHDLDFVERIADRVSFMHNGRILRTGTFTELSGDTLVQGAYMGTADEP